MANSLFDQVIIVTGGGGGIGSTVVQTLAKAGAAVVIADVRFGDAENASLGIESGKKPLPMLVDLCDWGSVQKMVETTLTQFGRVDGLVNAGGIQGPIGPLADNEVEAWLRTLDVNLAGTFRCCKAVLPTMIEQKHGSIVNFSGGGATGPRPNYSAYAASKTGVVRLTEILAEEVKKFGIRVNAIAPGAVNTRMLTETLDAGSRAGGKAVSEAQKQLASGGTPPQLAANLIAYLLSDQSRGLSGKLISAPHDGWETWDQARIDRLMEFPIYTLRRIDRFTLRPINEMFEAEER
jgi:NAD(P)-dependent dehydrogenase (short-subunit alcohol dehydrogenase family)